MQVKVIRLQSFMFYFSKNSMTVDSQEFRSYYRPLHICKSTLRLLRFQPPKNLSVQYSTQKMTARLSKGSRWRVMSARLSCLTHKLDGDILLRELSYSKKVT